MSADPPGLHLLVIVMGQAANLQDEKRHESESDTMGEAHVLLCNTALCWRREGEHLE